LRQLRSQQPVENFSLGVKSISFVRAHNAAQLRRMTLIGKTTSRFGVRGSRELRRLLEAIRSRVLVILRGLSCYRQMRHERDYLSAMDSRALRDIGLTANDAASMAGSLNWRQSWRWVRSCRLERCQSSAICVNQCRPLDPRR
jgi:uncharacterized protein YjiS (DUF1127 family)